MGVDAKLLDSLLVEQSSLNKRRDKNSDKIKSLKEENNKLYKDVQSISDKIYKHLRASRK